MSGQSSELLFRWAEHRNWLVTNVQDHLGLISSLASAAGSVVLLNWARAGTLQRGRQPMRHQCRCQTSMIVPEMPRWFCVSSFDPAMYVQVKTLHAIAGADGYLGRVSVRLGSKTFRLKVSTEHRRD